LKEEPFFNRPAAGLPAQWVGLAVGSRYVHVSTAAPLFVHKMHVMAASFSRSVVASAMLA
jgi:hypothetical protein